MSGKHWLPVVLVWGIGVASVWPILAVKNGVSAIGSDGVFLIWVMNRMFSGNIFFPHGDTIAFSERMLPSAFLARPFVVFGSGPGAAFQAALVAGQLLVLTAVFGWWWDIGRNSKAALVAALAFGLSHIRFHYQTHLQLWTLQWWLLAGWLWWRYLKTGRTRFLVGSLVFLGLQVWESLLPVYFGISVLVAQCLVWRRLAWSKLVVVLVGAGLIGSPILWQYWWVGRTYAYQRTIRDAAAGSLGVDELANKFFSPGLFVLGATLVVGSRRWWGRPDAKWLMIVLGVGLVLAMGPVVKWQGQTVKLAGSYPIPLPYAPAYYLVPGFTAVRTPSRWIELAAWAVSGLVVLRWRAVRRWWPVALGALVTIGGGARLTQVMAMPGAEQLPVVYRWLAAQPGRVVVELPAYPWGENESREVWRMYYSLYHGKYLVNGYSGFTPPDYLELTTNWQETWSNTGADYVVVHKQETAWRPAGQGDKIVYEDQDTLVYRR